MVAFYGVSGDNLWVFRYVDMGNLLPFMGIQVCGYGDQVTICGGSCGQRPNLRQVTIHGAS